MLAIGAVAMPTAVKLKVEKREKELADLFLQWSKIAFSLALVAGLYLVVLGTDFIRVWIRKPDFDSARRRRGQRDPDDLALRVPAGARCRASRS